MIFLSMILRKRLKNEVFFLYLNQCLGVFVFSIILCLVYAPKNNYTVNYRFATLVFCLITSATVNICHSLLS